MFFVWMIVSADILCTFDYVENAMVLRKDWGNVCF